MEFCIDDLDNEDRGALNHYRRVNKWNLHDLIT
jgi:hypothetical protein